MLEPVEEATLLPGVLKTNIPSNNNPTIPLTACRTMICRVAGSTKSHTHHHHDVPAPYALRAKGLPNKRFNIQKSIEDQKNPTVNV